MIAFTIGLNCGTDLPPRDPFVPADPDQTTMVAGLNDPIDPHRNVVWCAAFLTACEELRDAHLAEGGVLSEPVQALLDRESLGRDVLPENDYFSFGGRNTAEVRSEQEARLRERFPEERLPGFGSYAWIGYCLVHSKIRFTEKFHEDPVDLVFTDARGEQTRVRSFGSSEQNDKVGGRALSLYRGSRDGRSNIVELDYESPIEVLVIGSPRGDTLSDAWAEARARIRSGRKSSATTTLAVPQVGFYLSHHFPELFESRPDIHGQQHVWFSLDESGVELKAIAFVGDMAESSTVFDQPFLIALRVRGKDDPFFLLWVRNANVLIER